MLTRLKPLIKWPGREELQKTMRFDADFDELVDLDDGEDLRHLEKLNMVVTPIRVTPPAVRAYNFTCIITLPPVLAYLSP